MAGVRIWLEKEEIGDDLLKHNAEMQKFQEEIMQQKLAEVRNQFIVDFGIEGDFILGSKVLNGHRVATTIRGNDKRTNSILKAHPGWLGKFI